MQIQVHRKSFKLIPFKTDYALPEIIISGQVSRNVSILSMGYVMDGHLDQIDIPGPSRHPERKTGLWEATCFELFIGLKGLPRYWEFNLSPSGDWNIFEFESYRNSAHQNRLIQSDAVEVLPFAVQKQPKSFMLDFQYDLSTLIDAHVLDGDSAFLEMGISAVVRYSRASKLSYWALRHTGSAPDFHLRSNFALHI